MIIATTRFVAPLYPRDLICIEIDFFDEQRSHQR
jgi:hypothetical protein